MTLETLCFPKGRVPGKEKQKEKSPTVIPSSSSQAGQQGGPWLLVRLPARGTPQPRSDMQSKPGHNDSLQK